MLHELIGITNNTIRIKGDDLEDERAPGNVNFSLVFVIWEIDVRGF